MSAKNEQNEKEFTILIEAISTQINYWSKQTLEQKLQDCIKNGIDINVKGRLGHTALFFAVYNEPSTIQTLLNLGADINARSTEMQTPLIHAIIHNKFESFEILLKNNPNLTLWDKSGNTAINIAQEMYAANINFTKLLVEKGCDINSQNHDGWTALMTNICRGWDCVSLIQSGVDINILNKHNHNALMYAVVHKNEKALIELLKHHPNINHFNNEDESVFDLAKKSTKKIQNILMSYKETIELTKLNINSPFKNKIL